MIAPVLSMVMTALRFAAQSPSARRLPVRDGDVWLYAVGGIVLLVAGAVLISVSRRRR